MSAPAYTPKHEQGPGYALYSSGLEDPAPAVGELVLMCEWKSSRQQLVTGAALTCIVLAALNSETGSGLVGHFGSLQDVSDNPLTDRGIFDHAVEELPELGPPESTRLRLAGATIDFPGFVCERTRKWIANTKSNRRYAETSVRAVARESGIHAVQINWTRGYLSTDVFVDPNRNRITVWEGPA